MKIIISSANSGMRVMDVVHETLGQNWSKRQAKKVIELHGCLVNGQVLDRSTHRVKEGDELTLREEILSRVQESPQQVTILYEDQWLVAVDKPIGVESHAGWFTRILRYHEPLHLIHRLDKETSGVFLLAKSSESQAAFSQLFRERNIKKQYVAVVKGEVSQEKGTIHTKYAKAGTYCGVNLWTGNCSTGVEAITHWTRLAIGKACSYLLCQPHTGRTHQLRVHLSEQGWPILGDRLYGGTAALLANRLLLHAWKLSYTHPFTREDLSLESSLPSQLDWRKNG